MISSIRKAILLLWLSLFIIGSISECIAENNKDTKGSKNTQREITTYPDYLKLTDKDKKDVPIDKKAIESALEEMSKHKFRAKVRFFISTEYCENNKYNEAIYAYKVLKEKYPDRWNPNAQHSLCMSYIGARRVIEGYRCFWECFAQKIEPEDLKLNLPKYEIEFQKYIVERLSRWENVKSFPWYLSYRYKVVKTMLEHTKGLGEEYRKELEIMAKEYEELVKKIDARDELIELRKKQINDYLRKLEKLLVLKDEQKLRDFLNKNMKKKKATFFCDRYIKGYFTKELRKITFIIQNENDLRISGDLKETIHLDIKVKTDPPTSGDNCPEFAMTEINGKLAKLPCETAFSITFENDTFNIN